MKAATSANSMMMAFTHAMDAQVPKVAGENGCPELDTTSDPRVDLFFGAVRDVPAARLAELVSSCMADSRTPKEAMERDLLVLLFQTRNCRGGKGERQLFVELFIELYGRWPDKLTALLPLVPQYGCHKDLLLLAAEERAAPALVDACLDLVAAILVKDAAELKLAEEASRPARGLSLMGKWAPREACSNKARSKQAKALAARMFPEVPGQARSLYRQLCASLNKALHTVETQMCAQQWADIEPSAVPSGAMLKFRKALLNEALAEAPAANQRETGNRRPDDADRVECRKRVRETLLAEGMKRLKGKQLFPHQIVQKCGHGYGGGSAHSELELEIFDAQWAAIRADTKASMEAVKAARVEGEGAGAMDLGKLVPLVDVSGSMSGDPMEVAIALGILVSELTGPAFANRMLTFESSPTWVKLEEGASIAEKVKVTRRAPWGGSTDFSKALEHILKVCQAHKLTADQIPDMIVLSDMQFDQASGSRGAWETQHERMVRRFAEAGVASTGSPWPVPTITYWNLRGGTSGFPAEADKPGVKLLSGFSPSLLKLILDGGELEGEEEIEEEVVVVEDGVEVVRTVKRKAKANPLDVLRKCLDDPMYDAVREVLGASRSGGAGAAGGAAEAEAEAEAEVPGAAAAAAVAEDWVEVENQSLRVRHRHLDA